MIKKIVGVTIVGSLLLFLICSLMTYAPTDESLFYVTSESLPMQNKAGGLGAQCAALFFYLCGGAAFLWVIPLLGILYLLMRGISFRDYWERIVGLCLIIFVVSTLLSTYMVDFFWSPYPGGLIGLQSSHFLLRHCGVTGRLLFLHMSFVALIILVWQFSCMNVVRSLIDAVSAFAYGIKKYRVVERCVHGVMFMVTMLIVRPTRAFFHFMHSLYDGSALDETGALVPHDEYDPHALVFEKNEDTIIEEPIEQFIETSSHSDDKSDDFIDTVLPASVKDCADSAYILPKQDIFIYDKQQQKDHDLQHELEKRALTLQDKLKRFGVSGEVVAIKRGPVVTLFEYQPDIDTKLSKIVALEDDLAMALQALSIRILAPIPGKAVVGFEVANAKRNDVLFSQIVLTEAYTQFNGSLPLVLGKGTIGESVVVDLARMPHLLIAGSTGSGKSVALNALLMSLLCALDPDELKLILIDPKRLEFAAFTDIAHLLFPIVTSAHHAAPVLRWVVQEMEERYEKMAEKGVRNCADYNATVNKEQKHERLPLIVVVIDELADLMLTVGRDIEDLITRITQMARAAGIHMIVATQRPSVDVITGLIKANFPSRISFRVASRIDSRTILDATGADRLLGRGDMLFLDASTSQLKRVHGAYVSDAEIEQVVEHIRLQRKVEYLDIYAEIKDQAKGMMLTEDPLYKDVCLFIKEIDEISISLIQRKFRIGYNRSARIIDILESQGLIMPQDGGKMRKVIR